MVLPGGAPGGGPGGGFGSLGGAPGGGPGGVVAPIQGCPTRPPCDSDPDTLDPRNDYHLRRMRAAQVITTFSELEHD